MFDLRKSSGCRVRRNQCRVWVFVDEGERGQRSAFPAQAVTFTKSWQRSSPPTNHVPKAFHFTPSSLQTLFVTAAASIAKASLTSQLAEIRCYLRRASVCAS